MSMLVLLCGIPGSTKTTFRNMTFADTSVVCMDELRARVAGDAGIQDSDDVVARLQNMIVRERMKNGLLTVVDATNARHAYREPMLLAARQFKRPVVAVVFDYPVDECMTRIEGRDRKVPRDIVEAIHRDLHASFEKLILTVDVIAYRNNEVTSIVEAGSETWCWPKPADLNDVLPVVRGWFAPYQTPLPVRSRT